MTKKSKQAAGRQHHNTSPPAPTITQVKQAGAVPGLRWRPCPTPYRCFDPCKTRHTRSLPFAVSSSTPSSSSPPSSSLPPLHHPARTTGPIGPNVRQARGLHADLPFHPSLFPLSFPRQAVRVEAAEVEHGITGISHGARRPLVLLPVLALASLQRHPSFPPLLRNKHMPHYYQRSSGSDHIDANDGGSMAAAVVVQKLPSSCTPPPSSTTTSSSSSSASSPHDINPRRPTKDQALDDLCSIKRPLTFWPLLALIFYTSSGGPFGIENIVSSVGPLLAIVG